MERERERLSRLSTLDSRLSTLVSRSRALAYSLVPVQSCADKYYDFLSLFDETLVCDGVTAKLSCRQRRFRTYAERSRRNLPAPSSAVGASG